MMMRQKPAGGLLRGIAMHSLTAVCLFLSGGFILTSPLALFVPAVFINSGLRYGRKGSAGTLFLFLALLSLMIGAAAAGDASRNAAIVAPVILAFAIPGLIASELVRRNASYGTVVAGSLAAGAAAFGLGELIVRAAFGSSTLRSIISSFDAAGETTIRLYRQAGVSDLTLKGMEKFSDAMAQSYTPLILGAVASVSVVVSVMVIPRLPAGRETGPRYLFRNLALPDWMLFGFVLGGLSPLAGGSYRTAGLNLLGIVMLLYAIQGLAIVRNRLIRFGVGPFGTGVIFLMASLLAPYSAGLLFLAGLFDSFFDFRHLNRKEEHDESDSH